MGRSVGALSSCCGSNRRCLYDGGLLTARLSFRKVITSYQIKQKAVLNRLDRNSFSKYELIYFSTMFFSELERTLSFEVRVSTVVNNV